LHPDWQGAFYPADMPEEWQLDYYSNALHVVLVPEVEWLAWDEESAAEYADTVGEFWFYLAVEGIWDEAKRQQLRMVKQIFGVLLGGVVVFSENWLPDEILEGVRVSLVSSKQQLAGWSWQVEGRILSGTPFGYIEVLSNDGKAQANLLKEFMHSLPKNLLGAPFFIGGESINMAQVSNLKIVGEISGY
jgi:hypothetical protein